MSRPSELQQPVMTHMSHFIHASCHLFWKLFLRIWVMRTRSLGLKKMVLSSQSDSIPESLNCRAPEGLLRGVPAAQKTIVWASADVGRQ